MMKKLLSSCLLMLAIAASAGAQDFKTGYFLDNYVFGYRLNPAAPIEGEPYTFVGLGIGNITAEANTNFPFTSIISRRDNGDLVFPFMSPAFSEADALKDLADINNLMLGANINLLTFGRQGENNRFNVELNLRTDNSINAPKDFFKLVKRGLASLESGEYEPDYAFTDMSLNSHLYAEMAFGYTQKIGDVVTVGARLKGLVGFADAAIAWDLSTGPGVEKDLRVNTSAEVRVAGPVDLPSSTSDGVTRYDLESIGKTIGDAMLPNGSFDMKSLWNSFGGKQIAGWGAAADLGVTVEPLDGLSLSASVNDLGFISWKSKINGAIQFNSEIESEDYEQIFAIKNSSSERYGTMLNYTIHAGARYHMPFYDRLSVGLLGTFKKYYKEGRFGLTVTPLDMISIAGSAAYGTFGPSFGAAVNFRFPVVNLFVGMDSIVTKFQPGTPIPSSKLNTTVNAGLMIVI